MVVGEHSLTRPSTWMSRISQRMNWCHLQRSGMNANTFPWKSCGRQPSWGLGGSSVAMMLVDHRKFFHPIHSSPNGHSSGPDWFVIQSAELNYWHLPYVAVKEFHWGLLSKSDWNSEFVNHLHKGWLEPNALTWILWKFQGQCSDGRPS